MREIIWSMAAGIAWFLVWYLTTRKDRINRVTIEYLRRAGGRSFSNGMDALLKAGVVELWNRWELHAVCRSITKAKLPHPNCLGEILKDKDMLSFLKFCQQRPVSNGGQLAFEIWCFYHQEHLLKAQSKMVFACPACAKTIRIDSHACPYCGHNCDQPTKHR